jgi:protein TonB
MNNYFKLRSIAILSLALLVNLTLFAILPHFIKGEYRKDTMPDSIPVDLIRVRPPKPPPPKQEEEKKPQEKEIKEKITPTFRLDLSATKRVKMDRLSFEINPRLVEGMAVAPPPQLVHLTEKLPELTKPFYELSEVDQKPAVLLKLKPPYPYRARRFNISGYVRVKFLVDKLGQVTRISILKSSPEGVFDNTVRDTIASWKFSPGKIQGKPVSTWVVTTITFEMG